MIPRVVTEAFLALQEARKKARIVLPPEPDIWPPTEEELLKEKQENQAFDIVKESHKLVRQLEALELPDALREQLAKFASLVAECVPFPQEVEEEQEEEKHEEEESESSVEPEPFERTVRITFADYAPPGWETVGERESAMSMGRSSLQKRGSSITEDVLASETLVRGSLIEGSMMVASEGEGKLVGGELQEEEIAEPPFDANLVRGSLQPGSLRKGSSVRESLLDGELAGSEVRCT